MLHSYSILYWLVVSTPLKNMKVVGIMNFPIYRKIIQMFQTTNQIQPVLHSYSILLNPIWFKGRMVWVSTRYDQDWSKHSLSILQTPSYLAYFAYISTMYTSRINNNDVKQKSERGKEKSSRKKWNINPHSPVDMKRMYNQMLNPFFLSKPDNVRATKNSSWDHLSILTASISPHPLVAYSKYSQHIYSLFLIKQW